MKKLALTMALLLLACLLPVRAADASGVCGEALTWTLAEGTLTLSGQGSMDWYDMGAAPWYPYREEIRSLVVEEGVTALSYCAFFYLSELRSASLPASLVSIGDMGFYSCSALPELELPSGVLELGEDVFYGCRGLSAVRVDGANPRYRDDDGVLFCGAELIFYPPARPGTRYEIPAGTEKVGVCTFSYSQLEEVRIPSSVYSFHFTALSDCYALRSVETEGWYYTARDGVLFSGSMKTLICYPPRKTGGEYRVPAAVETVVNRAFAWNPWLQRVEFPGSLSELGSLAFVGCTALRRVVFYGDAPSALGYRPLMPEAKLFYLPEKAGWQGADAAEWDAGTLAAWTKETNLLAPRGRLTQ